MEVEKRLFKIDWQYWTQVTQLLSLFDNQITIYIISFSRNMMSWVFFCENRHEIVGGKLQKETFTQCWIYIYIVIFVITLYFSDEKRKTRKGKWNWQWVVPFVTRKILNSSRLCIIYCLSIIYSGWP